MSTQTIKEIVLPWDKQFDDISLDVDVTNTLIIEREVIPIIFLPGIMGSVLEGWSEKHGKWQAVWNPDSSFSFLFKYGLFHVTASDKRNLLIGQGQFSPDYLRVQGENKPDVQGAGAYDNRVDSEERGWEGVYLDSYEKIREYFETQKWGGLIDACFHLPVHAFGYNWTDSCANAAKKLHQFIDELLLHYQQTKELKPNQCRRVILLTHSMGGLVARALCADSAAAAKVVGVVHGVQPVNGAAAAFWRMKGGFERKGLIDVAAWCLGSNGAEVTALLGNMPGGLELLPNKKYTDNNGNKQWLQFVDENGQQVLPAQPESNPYDMYCQRDAYFTMVDDAWLNPASSQIKEGSKHAIDADWQEFCKKVRGAEAFHEKIADVCHPNTYYFYGTDGGETADQVRFICTPQKSGKKRPPNPPPTKENVRGRPIEALNWCGRHRGGGYEAELPYGEGLHLQMELDRPSGRGDGTVPRSSAQGLGELPNREGSWFTNYGVAEVGHEGAYKNEELLEYTRVAISEMLRKLIVKDYPPAPPPPQPKPAAAGEGGKPAT